MSMNTSWARLSVQAILTLVVVVSLVTVFTSEGESPVMTSSTIRKLCPHRLLNSGRSGIVGAFRKGRRSNSSHRINVDKFFTCYTDGTACQ